MPQRKASGARKLSRGDVVETSVIVGLAALVVIKGGGAIGGVFSGIGQMIAALASVAMH
ncbi:MAG: hypothetical protein ACXW3K_02655 [Brevundimonas sp.]